MSLQRLKEVAAFQRFLEHRVHNRDENDERNRQLADAMKIDGVVKNFPREKAEDLLNQKKGDQQKNSSASSFPRRPQAKRGQRPASYASDPQDNAHSHHAQDNTLDDTVVVETHGDGSRRICTQMVNHPGQCAHDGNSEAYEDDQTEFSQD